MAGSFKDSIKSNINLKNKTVYNKEHKNKFEKNSDEIKEENSTFVLKKKVDDKKGKKVFNVYMKPELLKELDRASKRSGWSRNELVNKMIEYCIDNLKIEE